MLKRLPIFFLLCMLTSETWAQGVVTRINNHSQVLARLIDWRGFKAGGKVMIISGSSEKVIALGVVHDFQAEMNEDIIAKIDIVEVLDQSLVLVGDEVELLDHRVLDSLHVPGFNSLTIKGDARVPAKYKDLAYMGVFSADGHTLDKSEALVSPFQVEYGLRDDLTVKVVNALFFDGYANVGAKVQMGRNEFAKFTMNAFGAYKLQSQDWIGQFGGILTVPSNAKFQTHWMANFTFDPQFEEANATKELGLYQDSDIRSIVEYITDDWNRVLFGPTFNVELQTFGGTLSYMWIWDTFHMSAGAATRNFSDLSIGRKSYYYVYDFFWRF